MKQLNDPVLLEQMLERKQIRSLFEESDLDFRIVRYEKGEMLSTPLQPLTDLLFVLEGKIKIYGLGEDGSTRAISLTSADAFLGDMEFVRNDIPPLFTEAQETVTALALPIERYRPVLEKDNTFLRFLLGQVAYKVYLFSMIGHPAQSVEDRVLTYLRDIQPDHTLHGINAGMLLIHSSRAQLQRVVRKLCEEGTLEKIGKGSYRLCPDLWYNRPGTKMHT